MPTSPIEAVVQRVDQLPPYRVILHNDDVNTSEYVTTQVVQIAHLPPEEAVKRVDEADQKGQATLLVTHLERAELYVDQFQEANIKVTCERL
jgi:ATP-dependent Clp protease adaptor protein ClpS